jgi:rhamnose utilization protein RhaD (predicted bifunctional aldolase and dehydrogenase)
MEQSMSVLEQLKKTSARIGVNSLHIQGAGGNTSVKDEDILWVKASGTRLADAEREDIFVGIHWQEYLSELSQDFRAPVKNHTIGHDLKPSIEASLHCLMPHKVVLHTHSIAALSWLVRADAESGVASRLAGINYSILPYVSPGTDLAEAFSKHPPTDAVLLKNHGIVVGAESVEQAESLLESVCQRLTEEKVESSLQPDTVFLDELSTGTCYAPARDRRTHLLWKLTDSTQW